MPDTLFEQYSRNIPEKLAGFSPFAQASDRDYWRKIPRYLRDAVLTEGEKVQSFLSGKEQWPALLASDYLLFSRTGNRVRFEDRYFKRRNRLTLLVLAECIEHEGRFVDDIIDGVFLLCEESGWQLPPHNSYARDTPQLPLPDSRRPVIDLFACETGAQLAVIYYLLKSELDAVSPVICCRIEKEITVRIVAPYLTEHFWWMGNGDEPMCNWTPWCTQNVLLAAFLTPCGNADRHRIINQALYSLDCFLKDYGDDGCCSEGAEYYRHAGLCLFNAADILAQAADSGFGSVFSVKKIRNIAEYIMNMHVPESSYYINFSDCSPVAGKSGVREYLFGKRVHSIPLCGFAADEWKKSTVREKLLGCTADSLSCSNIYYLLQSLFTADEIDKFTVEKGTAPDAPVRKNIRYESTGVYIMQTGQYTLAVKAGCNGDSHNHNDTGSIILYKNGRPFIIDLGVESYTKKTFSRDRYDIWTMQSAWHNLPTINGVMQKDGKEYAARAVECSDGRIRMDIAGAYPAEAHLSSYVREVSFSDDGTVRLHDTCTMNPAAERTLPGSGIPPVQLSLILCEKPELQSAGQTEIPAGSLGTITLIPESGGVKTAVETVPVTDPRLRIAWPDTIYRLLVSFSDELTILFR